MIREEGEEQESKRSKTVKCTNATTCKGGLTEKQKKELQANGRPLVIKYPRVRDQSNAAKAAKSASKASQASVNISQPPDSQSQ